MRAPQRERAEDGTAAVEFIWLTVLLMVPLIYVLISVFAVQRASFGADAAAQAAARAYSLASSESQGAAVARKAASIALADQSVGGPAAVSVLCKPHPGNCLAPDSIIEVRVVTQVALPMVPDALGGGAPSVRVEATHAVVYGTYREDR